MLIALVKKCVILLTADSAAVLSKNGVFLRSGLTRLVHNWLIPLAFETTENVAQRISKVLILDTRNYLIEMNSLIYLLKEIA